jgi:non-heme chloroperoxidase
VEPVGSNSGAGTTRRRMLQMAGAAAAIPAFSGLGADSALARQTFGERPRGSDRDRPVKVHTVQGGGGLRLHVREWGRADGPPILFIHGLSQNHLCWVKQYDSTLADEFRLVAYDLRGHGMSEAPLEPEHYTDGQLWADDVAAIIDELGLVQPVLVGWSYGPFVICDYMRAHGQDRISAINFVEGAVKLGPAAFGTLIGPGFLDNFPGMIADDLPTNIQAMRSFVRACVVKPVSDDDIETAVCWNVVVPAAIRANLAARELDCDDVLGALNVPLLVTQGRADSVVLPAMAEHILATCPTSEASWYKGVGHMPFLETPQRFNRELAAFTRRACGRRRTPVPP